MLPIERTLQTELNSKFCLKSTNMSVSEVIQPNRDYHGLDSKEWASPKSTKVTSCSSRYENSSNHDFENVDIDDLMLGKFRGRGKYTKVYDIKGFSSSTNKDRSREDSSLSKERFAKSSLINSDGRPRYVVKFLSNTIKESRESDPEIFRIGVDGFVLETHFLKRFDHPNIIKMRGHAKECLLDFGPDMDGSGLFLLLDSLDDTLEDRIRKWKREQKFSQPSTKGSFGRMFDKKSQSKSATPIITSSVLSSEQFLLDRLQILYGIASALSYLHDHNIIYRDLKPSNLGFDSHGNIKLFDFGLAKQLPIEKDMNEDSFRMSFAGTLRYMAPEVITNKAYNLKADVYSFAILQWELLALETPYECYRGAPDVFHEMVTQRHERPYVNPSWPGPIRDMLEMSFDHDLFERPQMMLVLSILGYQIRVAEEAVDIQRQELKKLLMPNTSAPDKKVGRKSRNLLSSKSEHSIQDDKKVERKSRNLLSSKSEHSIQGDKKVERKSRNLLSSKSDHSIQNDKKFARKSRNSLSNKSDHSIQNDKKITRKNRNSLSNKSDHSIQKEKEDSSSMWNNFSRRNLGSSFRSSRRAST